jgi:hypothetical protein
VTVPRLTIGSFFIAWIAVAAAVLSAAPATAAEPSVTARPLEGDSVKGRLIELGTEKIKIAVGQDIRELAPSKLMWIEFAVPGQAQKPSIWLELIDGSRVSAVTYLAREGKATVGLATGQTIEMPTRSIRTVRFQQQSPELAGQWREITSSMAAGDMIVMRKTSTRTIEQGENEPRTITEQALDQLEGTLHEVTADTVRFEIDGEKAAIRREKLEGLVYYQPNKREAAAPRCRLHDAAGSSWALREAALAGNRLSITTVGNVSFELPLNMVAKLDFSVGNVAFLADLEPDSGGGEIRVSLQPAAMTHTFGQVFQVSSRPPNGASAFRIGGQRFENGLAIHSPSKLVYRVPDGFKKFFAVAGVDDTVVASGSFSLVILGDGKELHREKYRPENSRDPLPLEFNVGGIRRITISLEPAEGQDLGDQLDLCEARFTR